MLIIIFEVGNVFLRLENLLTLKNMNDWFPIQNENSKDKFGFILLSFILESYENSGNKDLID